MHTLLLIIKKCFLNYVQWIFILKKLQAKDVLILVILKFDS